MEQKDATTKFSDQISESRRRLLKAAATTAPVIATLQSGAAFANASAFNCIAENAASDPLEINDTPDGWVRKQVTRYKFINTLGEATGWVYDINELLGGNGTYYQENGGSWDKDDTWKKAEFEEVWVLVYYYSQPSVGLTDATEVGPFPKFRRTDRIGQTALRGSCLCSVNPDNDVCLLP